MRTLSLILVWLLFSSVAHAQQIVVTLPADVTATSARALAPSDKPGEDGAATPGQIGDGGKVTFDGLQSHTAYDLEITLKDGRILRGVNLGWYNEEPAKPDAGDLTDDDHEQIRKLITDVQSFYNISQIIALAGDHDRAVVLVERTRTAKFHSDKGAEVVYRMEIWYFKNQFGGWQELTEENKVLIRKRLPSDAQYKVLHDPVHWIGKLGGITVGEKPLTISLDKASLQATPPATAPADNGTAQ